MKIKKRLLYFLPVIAMGIFAVFVPACTQTTEPDDNVFQQNSTPFRGQSAIEVVCPKECDINAVELVCSYGYLTQNLTPPSGMYSYKFDREIFLYTNYSFEEFRTKFETPYDESKAYLTYDDYMDYFNNTYPTYHIVKDIPAEEYLTEEYYVRTGGILQKSITGFTHQETITIPKEELLLRPGIIRPVVLEVFYSEEKQNYYIVPEHSAGSFLYKVADDNVIFNSIWADTDSQNNICYYDRDKNLLDPDTFEKQNSENTGEVNND